METRLIAYERLSKVGETKRLNEIYCDNDQTIVLFSLLSSNILSFVIEYNKSPLDELDKIVNALIESNYDGKFIIIENVSLYELGIVKARDISFLKKYVTEIKTANRVDILKLMEREPFKKLIYSFNEYIKNLYILSYKPILERNDNRISYRDNLINKLCEPFLHDILHEYDYGLYYDTYEQYSLNERQEEFIKELKGYYETTLQYILEYTNIIKERIEYVKNICNGKEPLSQEMIDELGGI